MAIRPATPNDTDGIRALVRSAEAHGIAAAIDRITLDDTDLRVLTQDCAIVGVLVLADRVDHLLIETALVDPTQPNGGFQKALLAFAEQEARNRDHDTVRLAVDERRTDDVTLCRSLGYRAFDRIETNGHRVLIMGKAL